MVIALGSFAWKQTLEILKDQGFSAKTKSKFFHGAKIVFQKDNHQITLLGSYHPSQQNTFTGKLTEPMLNAVFKKAKSFK